MAEVVTMPKLGFDMQEGTLVRWVKQIGDEVAEGDVLAEIETDKATVEVEAYVTGILRKVFYDSDSIVEVGAPIAIVGTADENIDNLDMSGDDVDTTPAPVAESAPAASAPAVSAPATNGSSGDGYPGGVKASPVARRIAEDKGINLTQVAGSGPGGRIVKRDVEGFSPADAPAAGLMHQVAASAPVHAVPTGMDIEEIALTRMRQIVGQRTQDSFRFVPHFYVTSEIDMEPVLNLRKELNATIPAEQKITVNDMIVKAVAIALQDFPNLNTHFHGDKLVRHRSINIGIAVAVENGLINVVCQNPAGRTLTDISVANKTMIGRARDGKIKPEDVEGATFTVSNLGAFDVEHFLAIINPPEAAILAVGSALEVPVVINGELAVGVRMKATISIDHRVSDGAEGAQFMQRLKQLLENPIRLLV